MKFHFWLGLLMIALGEFMIFKPFPPISTYLFFSMLWFGLIFTIDGIIYARKGKSLIVDNFGKFLFILLSSSLFWWFFELINIGGIQNWNYIGIPNPKWLLSSIAFSTILPAVFGMTELLATTKLFSHEKLNKSWKITTPLLIMLIFIGIISFALLFIFPRYSFALTWSALVLIIDPINYMRKLPSLLGLLENKKVRLILLLMLGTLICGFFWEFWNYWAPVKWTYDVPIVGFLKIFEMPLLGYSGYLPFGLELYVMYHFVTGFFGKFRKKLEYNFD